VFDVRFGWPACSFSGAITAGRFNDKILLKITIICKELLTGMKAADLGKAQFSWW
jgi:hypothetical protein